MALTITKALQTSLFAVALGVQGFAVELASAASLEVPDAGGQKFVLYAKSYALLIGIKNYESWRKLTHPIIDVGEIAKALESTFDEVKVYEDLNAENLKRVIEEFVHSRGLEKNTRILIWFAGHGEVVQGESFLIPRDAPPSPNVGPNLDEAKLSAFYKKALSLSQFDLYMRRMTARHVLAVFDSCFAGTIFETTRSNSPSPPVHITRSVANPTREFITSGGAGQEVADNGKFREAFISAITGADASIDPERRGYLTTIELFSYMHKKTTTNTQEPRHAKLANAPLLTQGNFVFELPWRPSLANLASGSDKASPEPLVWMALAPGTKIVNPGRHAAPTFTQPAEGAPRSNDIPGGTMLPLRTAPIAQQKVERATINGEPWIRFQSGPTGNIAYVQEKKIEVIDPP